MCSKIGKRYNKDKCPFQSQDAMFWNSFNAQLMKNEQTSSLCFETRPNRSTRSEDYTQMTTLFNPNEHNNLI